MRRRKRSTESRGPGTHLGRGPLLDLIGKLQFEFLVSQGLLPRHNFLDVGCGTLRGGVHFIRYLEPSRYVGFDISQERLDVGRAQLEEHGLADRDVVLVETGSFDVRELGRRFDFALALSVFTHLPLNTIIRCLARIGEVLAPDGRFFATFFEVPSGKSLLEPIEQPTLSPAPKPITTHLDEDPFHYEYDTLRWASERLGLTCEYIGEWAHPRGQRMLSFRRSAMPA